MPYCRSGAWEAQTPSNTALVMTATMPVSKARAFVMRTASSGNFFTAGRLCSSHGGREIPGRSRLGTPGTVKALLVKSDSSQTCEVMSTAPEDDRLVS